MKPVQESNIEEQLMLDNVEPIQLIYNNIEVVASIQIEEQGNKKCCSKIMGEKVILKKSSGKFSPGTFTAIVGPSGCGKTTMLNLLSGRLLSPNLELFGYLSINGEVTDNIGKFKSHIGYVMQEDLLLPTFTPTETFKFIADMRLPQKTQEEKGSVGLTKCRDTYIGNNLIRGVSGGQRKRTSIGVQLLINPSMIYLDQPTTGLDSTTALNLIRLLNRLAKSGRTVISTIHQPSSQIFLQFDRLMLMVDGNIVYNDGSMQSIQYFRKLNLSVPVHTNPLDFYMKLMNKQGMALQYMEKGQDYNDDQIDKQFGQRVTFLVDKYSQNKKQVSHSLNEQLKQKLEVHKLSWIMQMLLLLKRSLVNQVRNPADVAAKILQSIFFAVITIILYQKKGNNFNSYDQNLKGTVFFFTMTVVFGGIFASVNAFNIERPVFIRQRLANTYDTSTYFMGRTLSTLPTMIIVPVVYITIAYFAVNLNNGVGTFFYTVFCGCLAAWMSSTYGLLLSALIADSVVVMALVPILIIPLLLVAGFFTPLSNVPIIFKIISYISPFKYAFEAMIQIQYMFGARFTGYFDVGSTNYDPTTLKINPETILNTPQYAFDNPFWLNMFLLFAWGLFLSFLTLVALYLLSNPKRMHLSPPRLVQDLPIKSTFRHDNPQYGAQQIILVKQKPKN